MRLLEVSNNGQINLREFPHDKLPRYAILSHTWGDEEVTFRDLIDGTGRNKIGYQKIEFCRDQAIRDGLQYFWIDTCCIDKSSSTELQTSINYMFRWYQDADQCYIYLSDVSIANSTASSQFTTTLGGSAFRKSRWFTRGWTLQELIAPTSATFFSREGKKLGDKTSLEQVISSITGIPISALRHHPLSNFSISERMRWMRNRQTTLPEDKAYSLFGIFDVQIPLLYGEGEAEAFSRLNEKLNKTHINDKDMQCLQDLCLTDPRDDKSRIQQTKGGLLEDSYRWILTNADFLRWRHGQSGLLWIKGDPGKGKTMLLCGIIDELSPVTKLGNKEEIELLSYFFCQAADGRINNAIAVLRGLIFLLVKQQPSLITHIRESYDDAGKRLFEDTNSWFALSRIFKAILLDSSLKSAYIAIDGLDECVTDLPLLLDLLVQNSSSAHIKWIVSSRNWPNIEKHIDITPYQVRLCLELNHELISAAVGNFIRHKMNRLSQLMKYDARTRDTVQDYLLLNANDTFLWVALVCQSLESVPRWKVLAKIQANEFPSGLGSLYQRMMDQIHNSDDADLCRCILATVTTVYRPLTLRELSSFVDLPGYVSEDEEFWAEIIGLCGSFLCLRQETVHFVHQSAQDFLSVDTSLFPSGMVHAHYAIFSKSMSVMTTLRRNIYNLPFSGSLDSLDQPPVPDPLAAVRYSCIYWVNHLQDGNPNSNATDDLGDNGSIHRFLRQSYLHWLEALSILNSVSEGILSIEKLDSLLKVRYILQC
jgi:hypothetical protein